jgi:hypothetical protein
MSFYLALETEEERKYARQHALWLRRLARQLRERDPNLADNYDQDVRQLEDAIRRSERGSELDPT